MRIAWFTPLARSSAIGEFSCRVTAALAAQGADVELWSSDADPLHRAIVPVRRFGRAAELDRALDGYDAIVYNVGNFLALHGEIHDVSRRRPGIVILHDRVLHHMLVGAWQRHPPSFASTYLARMTTHHGERGGRVAREVLAGVRRPPWECDAEVVEYPLDVAALHGALGAVTHSRGHASALRERWLGPVRAIPLPSYRTLIGRSGAAQSSGRADGRLQLTTVGHVIANKNVDRVIRILADDPRLAANVHYTVAGRLEGAYGDELERLLRASPQVSAELLGWCEEAELDRLMAATDVFVNLRHPVFESGSASLTRELAYGGAVLCFDDGSFGELPRDAVARVPAADFAAAAAELARLAGDAERRRRLGEGALRYAGEHDETAYARELLDFVGEVQRATPGLVLLDRVAAELATMRADPDLPVYATIARDFGRAIAP